MRRAVLIALVFGVGCGGGGGSATGDDTPPMPDGPDIPDAPPIPDGYVRLIGRTWSLQPGQLDTYKCVRFTVPEDMYITSIQAQAPTGTHHTVLTFAGANGTSGADGEQDCSVGTLGMVMLYASGVGTDPLDFPDGVAVKISAGQQIHLNIHLFNASDNAIAGDSAILVKTAPTPPPQLAEMVFAGKFLFSIPANNQLTTVSNTCTANANYHVFAVWPHQHQIGKHNKVSITHAGVETVLHDGDFDFNEQRYYLQSPEYAVQSGDKITVACTWQNDTGHSIMFGESSNDEMCFEGLYRYPALNEGLFKCTDTQGVGF